MKRYSVLLLCLCAVVSLSLGGCSKKSKRLKLAFVTNNAADFWSIARKGCEQAASDLGNVDVDFKIPADATAAEQRRIIDDLLAKGVSGIAISPVDPVNQTQMINDVVAKDVLVVTQDSDAPQSNRACYLGTDNVAAGRQAGALIKQVLPDGGKIMVFVGKLDARNAQERLAGIKEAIKGSKVEIVDVRTDDTDQVRAKANAADTLVKYPDIACLVGLWSYNGPAILSAVKDAGKVGKVKIVCFDEQDDTLAGVKDGAIYATVVQQPFEFGSQSVRLMAKVVSGDRSAIPANKLVIIPTLVIKSDNVVDFTAKINKLRGRG
ncbi:MAG TPA: sugar-binding protein [Blastocatellia bacterium]|nr:sugar-binding protein [Blastocatellia bacterium]